MDWGLAQELACEGEGVRHDLLHGPEGDDLTAVRSCLGTKVDDLSSAAHGLLVMLDDKE